MYLADARVDYVSSMGDRFMNPGAQTTWDGSSFQYKEDRWN